MLKTKRTGSVLAAALLATGLFAAAGPIASTATADTATDLRCRKCVGAKDLGKKAVKTKSLRDNAVATPKIANSAVTTGKIANGAVTAGKIAKDAVSPEILGEAAKPGGIAFVTNGGFIALTSAFQAIQSVSVDAPGPGYISVTADLIAQLPDDSVGVHCDLRHDGLKLGATMFGRGSYYLPVSLTRAAEVQQAGTTTIELRCVESDGNAVVYTPHITALFVPARY
jgi:hypothetical protein